MDAVHDIEVADQVVPPATHPHSVGEAPQGWAATLSEGVVQARVPGAADEFPAPSVGLVPVSAARSSRDKIKSAIQLLRCPSIPRSSLGLDLLCLVAGFLSVHALYLNTLSFTSDRTIVLFSAVGILLAAFCACGLYQTRRLVSFQEEVYKLIACWFIGFAAIGLVAFLTKTAEDVSRGWVSMAMLTTLVLLVGARVIRSALLSLGSEQSTKNIVVYGTDARIKEVLQGVTSVPGSRVNVVRTFEHSEGVFDIARKTHAYRDATQQAIDFIESERKRGGAVEAVWIALAADQSRYIAKLSGQLNDSSVDVCVVPDQGMSLLLDGEKSYIGDMRVVNVSEVSLSSGADQVKRVFDAAISLTALVFLSLPMAIIALLIKLESPGPAIFKQRRYGVDGREIKVYKFRSMVEHHDATTRQATRNDSRITRLGGILRRTSLDELPQLYNVLQGRMSLVGPRPHAVAHNELWRHQIRGYMLRHKVRPGITGWAQVNGWRGETDTAEKMEERVRHDLEYIRNWSLWLDVKILFLTVFKGFLHKNAY